MTNTDNGEALELIKILHGKKNNADGIDYNVSTVIEINLLKSLLNFECEDYHITKAIVSIKDLNKINKESFEKIIKTIIKVETEKDQKTTWEIIIPFETDINRRVLILNGIRFKLLNFSTLRKKYPLEYYQFLRNEKVATEKIENKKCKYLIVKSKGRSLYNAWKVIEPTYGVIRGLLDFALSYDRWTPVYVPHIRTKVPHPAKVYGTSTNSRPWFLNFHVREYPGTINKIIDKKGSIYDKFAIFLRATPQRNSIQELLSDLFRLYNQAMDEDQTEYCFLKFWQIAERIALTDPNGPSNETIRNRISFFPELFLSYNLKSYINKLSKKRNNLVHRGVDSIAETDLILLKAICDRAILWLLLNKSQIKTIDHLEIFYDSRNFKDNEIQTTFDVLSYIKKNRKTK